MSRRLIKIQYSINGGEKKTIQVDPSTTVSDFLHLVKKSEKNSHFCAVYIRGRQLDIDDLVRNHVKGKDDILIVSDDPTKTSNDFVDVNVPIQPDDEEQGITDSLRDSLRQTDDVAKDVFGTNNKFKIYTTVDINSLLSGDKITIKDTDTFDIISNKIKTLIQDKEVELPDDFEMHIFLPGGIPFLSGKICSYFESANEISHNHLYVVVTKKLGDLINQEVKEPCNCSGSLAKVLSPLHDSTDAGLTQIASFLGYIYHHGINAEHLLFVLAKVTRFVPLITNYFRLLENAPLTYLNIIAITGPLFTFFRSLIFDNVEPKNVFEYTLKIITYIGLLTDVEYLHIHTIDWDKNENEKEETICQYLQETNQQKHVVIWEIDTSHPEFKGFNINDTEFDNIDTIFSAVSTYKPVPPLSLHYIYYPTFIRTNDENSVMLFLREVPNKKRFVRYIDPHVGEAKKIDIDELANRFHNKEKENPMNLIDHSLVEQINVICFDQSKSMKYKLEGGNCIHNEPSRAKISTDFLKALVEQSYKFRVSSIYGLISFGSEVKTLQNLTPMGSDFIEKLNEIVPNGKTLLWDAIDKAQKQIIDLIKEDEEEEPENSYSNARLRIIVITDGSDNKSNANPVDLANQLIENNIIVDTVLVSLDNMNNECCALSKITGGLCFRPEDISTGLKIFEQEAFLNLSSRHLTGSQFKGSAKITEEQFRKISKEFEDFDTFAENQEIRNAKSDFSLSTPLYMCYQYASKDPETIRKKRALLELNIIGHHPIENCQVYSSHANPVEWRIFIKGPDGTPFENKWLNLFMSLPNEYPLIPPKFRFLTVPFHPNVSSEGTVVFSLVNKKYSSLNGIGNLIKGIIELLAKPEADSPVNLEAMKLYQKDDKSAYIRKQESGDTGVDDYNEYIKVKVYSEVPEDVEIPEDTRNNPLYMTNIGDVIHGHLIDSDNSDDDGIYDT